MGEKFIGDKKNAHIYCLTTKIRLTMLCLSGFEVHSHWVPLLSRRCKCVRRQTTLFIYIWFT